MTSAATLSEVARAEDERVVATPSAAQKCERCWHYVDTVGSDAEHPTLCGRCASNLFGEGETRAHA
jgi:isoleucyl-tRNA synthetase